MAVYIWPWERQEAGSGGLISSCSTGKLRFHSRAAAAAAAVSFSHEYSSKYS